MKKKLEVTGTAENKFVSEYLEPAAFDKLKEAANKAKEKTEKVDKLKEERLKVEEEDYNKNKKMKEDKGGTEVEEKNIKFVEYDSVYDDEDEVKDVGIGHCGKCKNEN